MSRSTMERVTLALTSDISFSGGKLALNDWVLIGQLGQVLARYSHLPTSFVYRDDSSVRVTSL
jgi:hypothetical protein